MAKYQTRDQIFAFIGDLKLEEGFQTMSVDSYNEEEIGKTIKPLAWKHSFFNVL